MSDVIYLRPIVPPIRHEDVQEMAQDAAGCFQLHRVDWAHSFLSADGGRILCWYRAPDAESVRLALRQLGSDMNAVWSCSVIGNEDDARSSVVSNVNMVAEISRDERSGDKDGEWFMDCRQLLQDQPGVACLLALLATAGNRMVCLLQAADEASVRSALEGAELPAEAVWPCTEVTPHLTAT